MTQDEVRERLRFLSAAQHEVNTPLAIIRGWGETFAAMWEDLGEADQRRGTAAIQRYAVALTELLEALFVDLRADAHARAAADGTADLAEVVGYAVDQVREASLPGEVPGIVVAMDPTALESLIAAAASGLAMRCGSPVTVAVEEHPDGALVTVSPGRAEAPPPSEPAPGSGASGADPFDPFPGGDPSPAGIRLYAARRLATAVGGRAWFARDVQLRIVLPST